MQEEKRALQAGYETITWSFYFDGISSHSKNAKLKAQFRIGLNYHSEKEYSCFFKLMWEKKIAGQRKTSLSLEFPELKTISLLEENALAAITQSTSAA